MKKPDAQDFISWFNRNISPHCTNKADATELYNLLMKLVQMGTSLLRRAKEDEKDAIISKIRPMFGPKISAALQKKLEGVIWNLKNYPSERELAGADSTFIEWWLRASLTIEQDSDDYRRANYECGNMLFSGSHTEEDHDQAIKFHKAAIEAGGYNVYGYRHCASIYQKGYRVIKGNYSTSCGRYPQGAVEFKQMACDKYQQKEDILDLANFIYQNLTEDLNDTKTYLSMCLKYTELAYQLGCRDNFLQPRIQELKGYINFLNQFAPNAGSYFIKAYIIAEKSSRNNANYVLHVANCFFEGAEVPKNLQEATNWYQAACLKNNEKAQLKLAEIQVLVNSKAADVNSQTTPPRAGTPHQSVTATPNQQPVKPTPSSTTKPEEPPVNTSLQVFQWNELHIDNAELLGRGGFGDVYKVKWQSHDVAVKVLHNVNMTEQNVKTFIQEAEILAKCNASPYIVKLIGIANKAGQYAMVMEYMPKKSLYTVLQTENEQQLSWPNILIPMALDIAKGLSFMHDQNILHRDLKSLNILVGAHYEAKICDLGLAKTKTTTSSMASKATASGFAGSLRWSAPEVVDPQKGNHHSKASDIYSCGMIFWEMSSKKAPYYKIQNEMSVAFNIIKEVTEVIPPYTPHFFATLIKSMWQKPDARPTANQVVEEIEKVQNELVASVSMDSV